MIAVSRSPEAEWNVETARQGRRALQTATEPARGRRPVSHLVCPETKESHPSHSSHSSPPHHPRLAPLSDFRKHPDGASPQQLKYRLYHVIEDDWLTYYMTRIAKKLVET